MLNAAPRARARTATADGLVLDVQLPERPSERERLERMLARRIEEAGLPAPLRQYLWARPERMYRSDFAYVSVPDGWKVLVEVQGGIWAANPGRHNRGSGYQSDLSRANLAANLGFKLLAFTEAMIKSGEACETIKRALEPASRERHEDVTAASQQNAEQLCLTG